MSEEKTVIKGGFTATLALVISIVALVVAVIAFSRTGGQPDLSAEIEELRSTMENVKEEATEKVGKVREETAKALERLGIEIKKEQGEPSESP